MWAGSTIKAKYFPPNLKQIVAIINEILANHLLIQYDQTYIFILFFSSDLRNVRQTTARYKCIKEQRVCDQQVMVTTSIVLTKWTILPQNRC